MNLRPSGYEPDELPGCSTPRQFRCSDLRLIENSTPEPKKGRLRPFCHWSSFRRLLLFFCLFLFNGVPSRAFGRPGNVILSHTLRCSTIGAEGLHCRVRNGIGCGPLAITTRSIQHAIRIRKIRKKVCHRIGDRFPKRAFDLGF